ncbi:MAG: hypothetical protein RMJ44_12170 [Cytophagales bacterium]|nr:redoxin domain-containing protein [Bernardetiaceae bacterium]MDW8211829.1 hypothetical protein [Cytophagales bacterium]
MKRIALFSVVGFSLLATIGWTFWYQELQYALPTPLPKGYRVVLPGTVIHFNDTLLPQQHARPILLHFFSPSCPCSRFNLRHFKELYRTYGRQVDFYAVTSSVEDLEKAKKYLPERVTVICDKDDRLARACGVYSTPQAAIITTDNQLYFRGNYNRSRYCTDKRTNYVEQALESLLNNKPLPVFDSLATISYGCAIELED